MVNSRDCLNCNATNHNDCFRSKCITADGHTRPVSVVNRMLPGPVIILNYSFTTIKFLIMFLKTV